MKRIVLIGVSFGMILLLTGCGNTKELTCSMTEDASYASMTAEYHLVYEDELLTVMDQGAIIEVDEDYANYLSYYEDSFKDSFEDPAGAAAPPESAVRPGPGHRRWRRGSGCRTCGAT